MNRTHKPAPPLTAADVMNRPMAIVSQKMPLQAAARVLSQGRANVLVVTDDRGRFIGVLSAADLLRWAVEGGQRHDTDAWSDWQLMAPEARRATDEVGRRLTTNSAVAAPETRVPDLLRLMRDARACRVVVIDQQRQPVGVISATDLLAVASPTDSWPAGQSLCPVFGRGGPEGAHPVPWLTDPQRPDLPSHTRCWEGSETQEDDG